MQGWSEEGLTIFEGKNDDSALHRLRNTDKKKGRRKLLGMKKMFEKFSLETYFQVFFSGSSLSL